MKHLRTLLALLVLLVLMSNCPAKGCSLAIHDWKLVFFVKIPVTAPVFPLAEVNFLNANFKKPPVDSVYWLSGHNWVSYSLSGFVKALPGWPSKLTWNLVDRSSSVLKMGQDFLAKGQNNLILGSDKNFLKVAFFSDANSDYNCHQLVIMQNSRIRGVHVDKEKPWAQELNGMSWVSLIFFQLPYPDRVLSLSVFPHNFTRISLFEDHDYVESLLSQKLLRRRPDLEVDPFVFDFPELPD
jgi:hypothetical protein